MAKDELGHKLEEKNNTLLDQQQQITKLKDQNEKLKNDYKILEKNSRAF